MKNEKHYLILILLLCLIFVPVIATTESGTIGSVGLNYSQFTHYSGSSLTYDFPATSLGISNIQYLGQLKSVVTTGGTGFIFTGSPIPDGATTSVNIRLCSAWNTNGNGGDCLTPGAIIGHGTMGYQRVWSGALIPTLQYEYLWLVVDDLDLSGLSGNTLLYLQYNRADLYYIRLSGGGQAGLWTGVPTGMGCLGGSSNAQQGCFGRGPTGYSSMLKDIAISGSYTATDEAHLGLIEGTITKTHGLSQALVFRSDTGGALASESTQTNNTFNFTITQRSIILGLKDSTGIMYNTSTLFSAYIPPTPSIPPTPTYNTTITVTPTPSGNQSTIKVTVRDFQNLSMITNVNLGIIDGNNAGAGWYNITSASGSYLFMGVGTGGNTPLVAGHKYIVQAQKTGYASTIGEVYFVGTNPALGLLMQQNIYQPSASNFALRITLHDTVNGLITSQKIGTVTITNQSSSWTSTQSNPPAGIVTFTGLKAGDSYKIDVGLVGYQYVTEYFASSASMVGTTQDKGIYLTPVGGVVTPIELVVNPSTGTLNDTYSASLIGDISNIKAVSFKGSGSGESYFSFKVGNYYSDYRYIAGQWNIWDGSSWVVTTSPASMNFKFPEGSYQGIYTVTAFLTSTDDKTYSAQDTISLISSGRVNIRFDVFDGSKSLTLLFPYNIYVHDLYTNEWINRTVSSSSLFDNSELIPINPNTNIQYYADRAGFDASPLTSDTVGITDKDYDIMLYPSDITPVGNVTLSVNVRRAPDYLFIPNVKVTFSDGQSCYTASSGSCSITAIDATYYTATATAPNGYISASGSTTTDKNNPQVNVIYITLAQTGSTTHTIYPTRTVTGAHTPYPTTTYAPNRTAGKACSVSVGNATNPIENIKNFIACSGVESQEGQNALVGLIIMVFCGAILARYGKGMGAIAGVVAGASVSFYMALLPFWVLIFVCVAGGIVFAGKLFNAGDK